MYPDEPPPYDDVGILKLPPHSLEAEQSVLGGLLIRGQHYEDISDIVSAADFFQPRHRQIFSAIAKVHSSGDGIDIVTVAEALPDIEQIGGLAYLMDLANGTPSTANIRAYAKLVNTRAQERQLIEVAHRIADSGFNQEIDLDEKLAAAQQEIMAIGETSRELEVYSNNESLAMMVDRLDELHRGGGATGVLTGLTKLDSRLNGLQKSDLIILAARPSMGKSTLAFQIAAKAAFEDSIPTAVFSLEMSRHQIYNKFSSCIGKINLTHLHRGQLADDDWPRLSLAVNKMKDKPIFVDDRGGLHVNQIKASARRIHRKTPLGLIVIDYLQLIRGDGDNRTNEIGGITRALKGLAKELDCPVLLLSQLNRNLESRPDKRPRNSDLRDSGEIEQDADVIMFIYRDEVYNEETTQKGVTEILIPKFRNGQIGTEYLADQLHHSRFDNLAYEYRPPAEPDRKSYASGIDL